MGERIHWVVLLIVGVVFVAVGGWLFSVSLTADYTLSESTTDPARPPRFGMSEEVSPIEYGELSGGGRVAVDEMRNGTVDSLAGGLETGDRVRVDGAVYEVQKMYGVQNRLYARSGAVLVVAGIASVVAGIGRRTLRRYDRKIEGVEES